MQGLSSKEKEKIIYRIFDIEKFEQILLNKKIGFVIPSKWEDPYEDILYTKFKEHDVDFYNNHSGNRLFGQCWTFNEDSDAMWRIYSSGKRGIKIEVKLENLHDYLVSKGEKAGFDVLLTKVKYLYTNRIEDILVGKKSGADLLSGLLGDWSSFNKLRMKTLSYKRKEFSHEKEIRVLLHLKKAIDQDYFEFDFDINEIIKKITLDPRLSMNEFDFLIQKLKTLGFCGEIQKSELYQVSKNFDDKLRECNITSKYKND